VVFLTVSTLPTADGPETHRTGFVVCEALAEPPPDAAIETIRSRLPTSARRTRYAGRVAPGMSTQRAVRQRCQAYRTERGEPPHLKSGCSSGPTRGGVYGSIPPFACSAGGPPAVITGLSGDHSHVRPWSTVTPARSRTPTS